MRVPESGSGGGVVRLRRGGGLDQARLLAENFLKAHGLDPERHVLFQSPSSSSWLFWVKSPEVEGPASGALLVLSLFVAQDQEYVRLSSPILSLPGQDVDPALYRRLLDLNAEMVCAALATVSLEVHVVAVRPVGDAGPQELEDLLVRVAGYANLFKTQLSEEFGIPVWELAAVAEGSDEGIERHLLG